MRTISPALQTLFATARKAHEQELYTFTFSGGLGTVRYTSQDAKASWGGFDYLANGPLFDKPRLKLRRGIAVDDFELIITPKETDLILGRSWQQVMKDGLFKGCDVEVMRAYSYAADLAIVGVITLFVGRVGEIEMDGGPIRMSIQSHTILLDNPFPEDVFQPTCRNRVFDSRCGLNPASYTDTLTVGASPAPTRSSFAVSGSARAAGFYDRGTVVFNSGPCSGIRVSIASWNGSVINLVRPLPRVPVSGNGITLVAGCNKIHDGDCTAKFNNKANFRGEPFIPLAETAL